MTRILTYQDRIADFVLIRENTCQSNTYSSIFYSVNNINLKFKYFILRTRKQLPLLYTGSCAKFYLKTISNSNISNYRVSMSYCSVAKEELYKKIEIVFPWRNLLINTKYWSEQSITTSNTKTYQQRWRKIHRFITSKLFEISLCSFCHNIGIFL